MKGQVRILIAFDGSDQAMETVRYASRFFAPEGVRVHLFHVANQVPEAFFDLRHEPAFSQTVISVGAWASEVKHKMENDFIRAAEILKNAGFPDEAIQSTYHSRQVGVARDIVAESRQDYDVLMIGRSGVSRLMNVVVGSVANKLINAAGHLPVAVVGGSPEAERVLVGIDGSDGAAKAVACAGDLMARPDREVMLCHVVRSLNVFLKVQQVFSSEEEKRWLEESRAAVTPAIAAAENQLIDAGFHPGNIYQEVREEQHSRAGGIVEAVRQGDFGTIVVGRRGLSGVQEFSIGRVSRKVIHMGDQMAVWVV